MSDVEKLRFYFTDFLHNSLRMTIQNITFHSSSLPLNDALIHLIRPVFLLIIILKLLIKFFRKLYAPKIRRWRSKCFFFNSNQY